MYLVMVAKKNRCSTKQASLHLSVFDDSAQSECPHYIEAHVRDTAAYGHLMWQWLVVSSIVEGSLHVLCCHHAICPANLREHGTQVFAATQRVSPAAQENNHDFYIDLKVVYKTTTSSVLALLQCSGHWLHHIHSKSASENGTGGWGRKRSRTSSACFVGAAASVVVFRITRSLGARLNIASGTPLHCPRRPERTCSIELWLRCAAHLLCSGSKIPFNLKVSSVKSPLSVVQS